ncbi:hypothetical protein [Chryseobacterium sp. JK1]|uniref:hypothetical protein n=1 Tax=Chryseobacterium sp. JK1 TaxID=874294 RepID=UPI003D68E402
MKHPKLIGFTAWLILSGVHMNAQKKENAAPANQNAIERSNTHEIQRNSGEENSTTQ